MSVSSIGSDRIVSGQVDAIWRPRLTGRPAAVYCHSAGTNATEGLGAAVVVPSVRRLLARLVKHGFMVVATSQPETWGNTTSDTRLGTAITYARANGASNAPVVFVGASMGAVCALHYAAENETEVACVVGVIPVVDLDLGYQNDIGGTARASIGTAWGVTWPTALPAGADPADRTAELVQVPQQLWYASDDPWSTTTPTYGAAVGADLHNVGALNHTDAAVAAVDLDVFIDFVEDSVA